MNDAVAATGTLDPVQEQYERWSYPARAFDLSRLPLLTPTWHYHDVRTLYWLFWPQGQFRDDLDILVAGCGSLSAAAYAYVYPRCRVVGIDVSRTSLAHEEHLQQLHRLTNLTLHHCRIEDVSKLQADFDLIVCYGVLHHLADPLVGLRALAPLLRRDGVIDIMVYGKHGRTGVYMLQEAFRHMGLQQDPAGVQVVKDTLAALPRHHPVQHYRHLAADDLSTDEGLVDTFLHRRDRAFSCGDCLDLVEQAGLVFQGWKENGLYHLDTRLAPNEPLRPHLERLPPRELWQVVELLDASIAGHWFHACRRDRDPATYTIQFNDDTFLGYVPVARVSQMTPADPVQGRPAMIARPPFPAVPLNEGQAVVFRQFDGVRTVRQCLQTAGLTEGPDTTDIARRFFSALWRSSYVIFHLPGP
jgi:SAM-dependent methyltransferase